MDALTEILSDLTFERHVEMLWQAKIRAVASGQPLTGFGISFPSRVRKYAVGAKCHYCHRAPIRCRGRCQRCYARSLVRKPT